jgi:hypothetical protein
VKRTDYSPSLRGQKWRETHQATVDSILGPKMRTIRSQGTRCLLCLESIDTLYGEIPHLLIHCPSLNEARRPLSPLIDNLVEVS